MNVPVNVRASVSAEWAAIRNLLVGAGLPVEDLAGPSRARFLVAEDGGDIAGVIAIEAYQTAGLLRSLVVAPAHRGRGIGSALVGALERQARTEGMELLVLLTQTATRFFHQLGYCEIERAVIPGDLGRSAEFRSLCPASATCMAKSLR